MSNNLWNMMHDYQKISQNEDGISFTKEGFSQLYDAVIHNGWGNDDKVEKSFHSGIIVGVVGTGLTGLGIYTIGKLKRRKPKNTYEEN